MLYTYNSLSKTLEEQVVEAEVVAAAVVVVEVEFTEKHHKNMVVVGV